MALSSSKQLGRISWSSLLALGASAHAQDWEWTHHFRIGASPGMNINTHFRTTGNIPISNLNPAPATSQANHTYDNGYVKLDATGDAFPNPPSDPTQTKTTNWSYKDATQHDIANNTL